MEKKKKDGTQIFMYYVMHLVTVTHMIGPSHTYVHTCMRLFIFVTKIKCFPCYTHYAIVEPSKW